MYFTCFSVDALYVVRTLIKRNEIICHIDDIGVSLIGARMAEHCFECFRPKKNTRNSNRGQNLTITFWDIHLLYFYQICQYILCASDISIDPYSWLAFNLTLPSLNILDFSWLALNLTFPSILNILDFYPVMTIHQGVRYVSIT